MEGEILEDSATHMVIRVVETDQIITFVKRLH